MEALRHGRSLLSLLKKVLCQTKECDKKARYCLEAVYCLEIQMKICEQAAGGFEAIDDHPVYAVEGFNHQADARCFRSVGPGVLELLLMVHFVAAIANLVASV